MQETVLIPIAHAEEPLEKIWTPESLEELVRTTARKYGLNEYEFVETARCESANFQDPAIQSGHITNGKQEESYGIFQFNIEHNKGITKEQAQDPEWASEEAARWWLNGEQSKWTCWRDL